MGRYYEINNKKHGKFAFGLQPSNSPEEFGAYESNDTITYHIDNIEDIEQGIQNIKDKYTDDTLERVGDYMKKNDFYNDKDIAKLLSVDDHTVHVILKDYFNLKLGSSLLEMFKEDGYCTIVAEL